MESRTAAIVVNWNGSRFLVRLLDSIRRERPAEIVVIDNASTDGSREMLEGRQEIVLIPNSANLGFGQAANQGILTSSAPYVLILNVDTELMDGSIRTMETFLDDHPETALVAPQLLFPDLRLQRSCRSFPTVPGLFLYLSFLDHLIPSAYRADEKAHASARQVDQPMGAAMMIRRAALDRVGMFHPDFHLYMEDVDLCERMKSHGWSIFYLPEARVIHHAGGSSGQDWERSQKQFLQSVLLYFRSRSSPFRIAVLKCSLSLALLIRAFILLFSRRKGESRFWLKQSVGVLEG
jgi:GT2 family glycosyltransferase